MKLKRKATLPFILLLTTALDCSGQQSNRAPSLPNPPGTVEIQDREEVTEEELVLAYVSGRKEAERRISNGKMIVNSVVSELYGDPDEWARQGERSLLQATYGIEIETLRAGCVVSRAAAIGLRYVRGYNEVMLKAIEARYGEGVLNVVRRLAVLGEADGSKTAEPPL